mmetsp:Transcript_27549/g.66997  ORF Transcript_27549/g.66997 Transcript_27549/m.66997 type:complete len:360 (+) Transcript_27549:749-1828(+)
MLWENLPIDALLQTDFYYAWQFHRMLTTAETRAAIHAAKDREIRFLSLLDVFIGFRGYNQTSWGPQDCGQPATRDPNERADWRNRSLNEFRPLRFPAVVQDRSDLLVPHNDLICNHSARRILLQKRAHVVNDLIRSRDVDTVDGDVLPNIVQVDVDHPMRLPGLDSGENLDGLAVPKAELPAVFLPGEKDGAVVPVQDPGEPLRPLVVHHLVVGEEVDPLRGDRDRGEVGLREALVRDRQDPRLDVAHDALVLLPREDAEVRALAREEVLQVQHEVRRVPGVQRDAVPVERAAEADPLPLAHALDPVHEGGLPRVLQELDDAALLGELGQPRGLALLEIPLLLFLLPRLRRAGEAFERA